MKFKLSITHIVIEMIKNCGFDYYSFLFCGGDTNMKSEELRHRITLQVLETITNENGFEVETWVDFKDLWAKVENLHGREYFEAAAVQAENTVKFTIRYTKEIDTSMRILFKGNQYNINSIDNIKYRNKFIEIKTMEVENSG